MTGEQFPRGALDAPRRPEQGHRQIAWVAMPAGMTSNDSMFSVGETPWYGLGAVLDRPPATIADEASGLGRRVKREPIAVDRGDAAPVDDWWEPRCEEIAGYYAPSGRTPARCLGLSVSATESCKTMRRECLRIAHRG